MPEALGRVVVDKTASLHMGIDYGTAHELKPSFFKVFA
jgi:hypothetical protein